MDEPIHVARIQQAIKPEYTQPRTPVAKCDEKRKEKTIPMLFLNFVTQKTPLEPRFSLKLLEERAPEWNYYGRIETNALSSK